ncbi:phage tail assembly chaperone [Chromobacterium sp. TRC.1.1.SA]|uniref:Phage tail assembly chaperone n=1 Tax=Chromobacterium indicum TaxID=3110228 RepID=A0ABV0CDF2_9NEIS
MAKLTLGAAPTFSASVSIPQPGGAGAEVVLTFKHHTRTELRGLAEKLGSMPDIELVQQIATGWDLVDAWTPDNVRQLLENHHGAALAIWNTYVQELTGLREKN